MKVYAAMSGDLNDGFEILLAIFDGYDKAEDYINSEAVLADHPDSYYDRWVEEFEVR